MTTFTIKRSEWHRGEGATGSKLIRSEDNKMCCIGFVGLQCKVRKTRLLDKGYVSEARSSKWPDWFFEDTHGSGALSEAYKVNDDEKISDKTRESRLKKIFAAKGDKLIFVD